MRAEDVAPDADFGLPGTPVTLYGGFAQHPSR
jgi:hypothetical protein